MFHRLYITFLLCQLPQVPSCCPRQRHGIFHKDMLASIEELPLEKRERQRENTLQVSVNKTPCMTENGLWKIHVSLWVTKECRWEWGPEPNLYFLSLSPKLEEAFRLCVHLNIHLFTDYTHHSWLHSYSQLGTICQCKEKQMTLTCKLPIIPWEPYTQPTTPMNSQRCLGQYEKASIIWHVRRDFPGVTYKMRVRRFVHWGHGMSFSTAGE